MPCSEVKETIAAVETVWKFLGWRVRPLPTTTAIFILIRQRFIFSVQGGPVTDLFCSVKSIFCHKGDLDIAFHKAIDNNITMRGCFI